MTAHRATLPFLLIASATALGIAGTDLILPAVPTLSRSLGGTVEQAQLVLAAFTGGAALGLLAFGELGARFDQRWLLIVSLGSYAILSACCALSGTLGILIVLRFVQGAAGAGAAVFAPAMLRALYGDARAVKAIGLLGSIEALAPALAPVVGLWLLRAFDWRASFDLLAILAGGVAVAVIFLRHRLPRTVPHRGRGGYARLLCDREFLCLALSHAFTLGALLVFVFGAPTVFVVALDGTLGDFIVMQISGIALFALAANSSGWLIARCGVERLIFGGTLLTAVGTLAILGYALAGGRGIGVVTILFLLVNVGLAVRGPSGFHAAIVAAQDDARGAALLIVAILLTTAVGTTLVAPYIADGLVAIGTGSSVIAWSAVGMLFLRQRGSGREA